MVYNYYLNKLKTFSILKIAIVNARNTRKLSMHQNLRSWSKL